MRKKRKRHVQQSFLLARDKNGQRRGGKRPGAGRKPAGTRAGSPHKARPELKARFPVLVTLRVHRDVGSLRKRIMYRALRAATIAIAMRELNDRENRAFRIVHISIQRDHVHLLVEADNKRALSNGMQRFQISAAKHINAAVSITRTERRRGTVFPDRFHQEILETPRQTRNALSYVLNNWRKHREDRVDVARAWNVDPFSSGISFDGWKQREDAIVWWKAREGYDPLIVYVPKTWLLRVGWMKHGRISWTEVSGQRAGRPHRIEASSSVGCARVAPSAEVPRPRSRTRAWNVDPFSSGISFDGWKEREDATVRWKPREGYEPVIVYRPKARRLDEARADLVDRGSRPARRAAEPHRGIVVGWMSTGGSISRGSDGQLSHAARR